MKLISKIVKELGCSQERELQDLSIMRCRDTIRKTLLELIEQGSAKAEIVTNCLDMRYEVVYFIDFIYAPELKVKEPYTHLIKVFPFGDDRAYAHLCAEELCEIINQKS